MALCAHGMQRAGRAVRDALSRSGRRYAAAAAVASVLLAGCQSPPLTREEIAALDYGPRPESYETIVRDYVKARANEPDFVMIELKAGPAPLYQKETLLGSREHGWGVCVMVNDRDPRGVYQGFYPMVVYIRQGQAVASSGGALERTAGLRYAHAQCRQLGYEVP
jgi:hypothetical protein